MPGHWSPRVGLVRQNDHGGTFKLLYATAFSDPTVYQRYYLPLTFAVGNPDVQPERMESVDLGWEQRLGADSRVTTSLYAFRIKDMIGIDSATGISGNLPEVAARGAEVEFQHRWRNRAVLRVGYTRQQPTVASGLLENVPRNVLHGNLAVPLLSSQWLAGLEGQLVGARLTGAGGNRVPGYTIANANLSYRPVGKGWDLALGISNLFDRRYTDPVALDTTVAGLRDRMPQLGRSLRVKFSTRF